MEVHAHTHTPRKKWTHYLWEFLMLFLAVFCGFLAENQREHILEHQREKVLMKSMVKDLRTDTAMFSRTYRMITGMITHIDSLIPLLSSPGETAAAAKKIYGHDVWINLYYKVIYTDRTIQQLKNSGNFRLIRKNNVSDALIAYDAFVRNYVIQMQDDYIWVQSEKLGEARTSLFKASVFRNWLKKGYNYNDVELPAAPYFLSAEKSKLDNYINHLETYATANEWFLVNLDNAIQQAEKLDSLITQEYHFR